jgi:hypothetical protein
MDSLAESDSYLQHPLNIRQTETLSFYQTFLLIQSKEKMGNTYPMSKDFGVVWNRMSKFEVLTSLCL